MINIVLNDKIINNIDLVVFDRDGTLIDLYHYWSNMVKMRAETICNKLHLHSDHIIPLMYSMGVNVKNRCILPEGPVGLKKREIVMAAAIEYLKSIGITDTSEICSNAFVEIDAYSEKIMPLLVKPLNGLFPLINSLKHSFCKIAIATTDKTSRAKKTMDAINLTDKIDLIIGSDDVERGKPFPDMILKITKILNVNIVNVVMIGDAQTDIMMGINSGAAASIGVCSGFSSRQVLEKLTPYVIDSIAHIIIA